VPVGAGAANGRLVSYEARDLPVAARCPRTRYESAVMDLVVFLPLIIIMGAFMWFASRRQRKAMQATIDLHESLRVGDRVHTTSGLQATITGIADDTVDLEIAPGVVTTWMKLAVRDRIEPETPEVEDSGAAEIVESDADRLTKD
jgi:preprotein translocase subunit YajC